jgi:uroporphyrin-III C-methyltransferase
MPFETTFGKVLLVGAGPGPVDLMTVRAVRAVESAQALLYDALCSEEAVALAPPGCVRKPRNGGRGHDGLRDLAAR